MDLVEDPQSQAFRFLDLPGELRNLVYDHYFTLYQTPWLYQKAREMSMLPDGILNVNKQVYGEASHALYTGVIFVIKVTGEGSGRGPEKALAGILRKIPHVLRHTTTIHLEICWPRPVQTDSSLDWCQDCRLRLDMEKLCISLAKEPNLQTVKILIFEEDPSRPYTPVCPNDHRMLGLLRPLQRLRRAYPKIVVDMPANCPISTAELVKQQWRCPCVVDLMKKEFEDARELARDVRRRWGNRG